VKSWFLIQNMTSYSRPEVQFCHRSISDVTHSGPGQAGHRSVPSLSMRCLEDRSSRGNASLLTLWLRRGNSTVADDATADLQVTYAHPPIGRQTERYYARRTVSVVYTNVSAPQRHALVLYLHRTSGTVWCSATRWLASRLAPQ